MGYSVATPRCSVHTTAALIVAMALCMMPHFSCAQTQCNTTLLEAVRATPDLAILAAVIEASGLSDQLNRTNNVTVLAPDNAAFNGTNGLLGMLATNLTLEQVTSTGNNRAASILLYHIISTAETAAELTNGQIVPTALGNDYPLTVQKTTNPQTTVSFLGTGSKATVISADIRVCNSVVHVVNRVLLPATTLTAILVYNDSSATPGIPPSNGGGDDDGDGEEGGNPIVSGVPPAPSAATSNSFTGFLVLTLLGAIATALMM